MNRLHRNVSEWYAEHGRRLPWRNTRNPYRILLSEVMLQQTQVARVIRFYRSWLKKFPNFSTLANASKAEVLRQWSGLGYNNRALRLHASAQMAVKDYGGDLPRTIEKLRRLPGVGKYTAHAVLCFSYHRRVAVVDVNIRRIFSRLFWTARASGDIRSVNEVWKAAERRLPERNAYRWNQALMDIGSLICTAHNPRCGECPLHHDCLSAFSLILNSPPVRKKKHEPSFDGIPRRLYRGRILKMLHHRNKSAEELAGSMWKTTTDKQVRWIKSVLSHMQRDGLIVKRGKKFRLAE